MTFLTILSPEEIKVFEQPPQLTAVDRKAYFNLAKWAEEMIATFQTPEGKIGFVRQLGYFRTTKKFFHPDIYTEADIASVQRRLSLAADGKLGFYPKSTMHRHRALIREKLGIAPYTPTAQAILEKKADFLLAKQLRLKEIFGELLAKLEQLKIEVPSYYRLADLITERFRAYEKRLLAVIEQNLDASDRALLDGLLHTQENAKQDLKIKRYGVTLLKRPNQSTKPVKIKANIEDLLILRELFDKLQRPIAALPLSPDMIWHYATVVIKTQIFQIARRDAKRYLYLLCFIIHQYYCLLKNDTLYL